MKLELECDDAMPFELSVRVSDLEFAQTECPRMGPTPMSVVMSLNVHQPMMIIIRDCEPIHSEST